MKLLKKYGFALFTGLSLLGPIELAQTSKLKAGFYFGIGGGRRWGRPLGYRFASPYWGGYGYRYYRPRVRFVVPRRPRRYYRRRVVTYPSRRVFIGPRYRRITRY